MNLKGKTAFITGGSRGIGLAVALRLAEAGADLAIIARTREKLPAARRMIAARGARVLAMQADVRDHKAIKKAFSLCLKEFGVLHILINNAGVGLRNLFQNTGSKQWDRVIDTNLKGVLIGTSIMLPHFMERKEGMIINIASGAGKTGFPELSVYCASKFGVVGFTESLGEELGGTGVRVYAVCPGSTDTRMFRTMYPEEEPDLKPDDVARVIMNIVLGRIRLKPGECISV